MECAQLMDSVNKISKDFQKNIEVIELRALNDKQYKEIVALIEKNKTLNEEVTHLKSLLTSNDSLVIQPAQTMTNEEMICLQQIEIFKKVSASNELTLEEVKKFETCVKILRMIRNKSTEDGVEFKNLKTEDLLKFLEVTDGK